MLLCSDTDNRRWWPLCGVESTLLFVRRGWLWSTPPRFLLPTTRKENQNFTRKSGENPSGRQRRKGPTKIKSRRCGLWKAQREGRWIGYLPWSRRNPCRAAPSFPTPYNTQHSCINKQKNNWTFNSSNENSSSRIPCMLSSRRTSLDPPPAFNNKHNFTSPSST